MSLKLCAPYKVLSIFCLYTLVGGKVDFTNIKCEAVDKTYNSIKYCYIRAVNRTFKYLSAANNFHSKEPITNISVRRQCVAAFLAVSSTNTRINKINHTCPYDHDIEVNVLPVSHIDNLLTNILPFPKGDYQFVTSWHTYNVLRAVVRIYATLS